MSHLTLVLLAFGLAADAFAVSISSGITIHKMRIRHAMLIASFFGVFQAAMPLIGWMAGHAARSFVVSWDHWIAFGLLVLVGGKMIREALKAEGKKETFDPLNVYVLFVLAIATSIDALAVGVTLSFQEITIVRPILVIGAITFATSFAGTYIGDIVGHLFENKLKIVAGLVLIGIGAKILLEHLFLS